MSETLEIVIKASDQASSVFHKVGNTLGSVFKVGLAGASVGLGLFTSGLGLAIEEGMEAQENLAKTNAIIQATGGAAGVSSDNVLKYADTLSRVTQYSDDAIQSAENMLLTFPQISNKIFPDVTEMALDMGEMFGSTEQAALQLGKAFQSPAQQAGALRRMGVALTDQQIEQMKVFEDAGDIYSSQQILLKELQREFGGVARAAGATATGQLIIFKNKLMNIAEGVGTTLLPIMVKLGSAIADRLIPFFEQMARTVSVFVNVAGERGLGGAFRALFTTFKDGSGFFVEFFGMLGLGKETSQALADIFNEIGNRVVSVFEILSRTVSVFTDLVGERGLMGAFDALFTTFDDGSGFFVELFSAIGLGEETSRKLADALNSVGQFILGIVDEYGPLLVSAFERVGAVLAGGIGISIVTGLLGTLVGMIGALFSPIVLIIGAVTALSVAYDTNFLGMKDAVDSFVNWFKGTAMPAVIGFITSDVIPALDKLLTWFTVDALPAIITFITKDFIPLTLDLWAAIQDIWNKAEPYLVKLLDWFTMTALPGIINFITQTVIPTTLDLWAAIQDIWNKAEPYLIKLSDWFRVNAIPAILNIINNVVIPAFNTLRKGITDLWDWGGPKLIQFYNYIVNNIGAVKEKVFDPLIKAVESLIDWINKIHWPSPPSWLNTGSLTPGWAGFQSGGAFKGFGMTGEDGRELVYAPGGAYVFPNDLTERLGGRNITNNYTQNVTMSGGGLAVIDEFRLMEAWGS